VHRDGVAGTSLRELRTLANGVGLSLRIVQRTTARALPVPSIVDFRIGHYATVVERDDRHAGRDVHLRCGISAAVDGDGWGVTPSMQQVCAGPVRWPSSTARRRATQSPIPMMRWAGLRRAAINGTDSVVTLGFDALGRVETEANPPRDVHLQL
jgi:hypothetical protein